MGSITILLDPDITSLDINNDRHLVCIDLHADRHADDVDGKTLDIHLNVACNPTPIRCPSLPSPRVYYIGFSELEVAISSIDGRVINHYKSEEIVTQKAVETAYNIKREQSANFKLQTPCQVAGMKLRGDISAGETIKHHVKHDFHERLIQHINNKHQVRWLVNYPEGNAIRDYLAGNLYFSCRLIWDGEKKSGEVSVKPVNPRCFDTNRQASTKRQSLLSFFIISYKARPYIKTSIKGYSANFSEVNDG